MDTNILFISLEDDRDYQETVKRKQDEFLDLLSLYQKTGLSWIREELIDKAYQLHLLDKNFIFQI